MNNEKIDDEEKDEEKLDRIISEIYEKTIAGEIEWNFDPPDAKESGQVNTEYKGVRMWFSGIVSSLFAEIEGKEIFLGDLISGPRLRQKMIWKLDKFIWKKHKKIKKKDEQKEKERKENTEKLWEIFKL